MQGPFFIPREIIIFNVKDADVVLLNADPDLVKNGFNTAGSKPGAHQRGNRAVGAALRAAAAGEQHGVALPPDCVGIKVKQVARGQGQLVKIFNKACARYNAHSFVMPAGQALNVRAGDALLQAVQQKGQALFSFADKNKINVRIRKHPLRLAGGMRTARNDRDAPVYGFDQRGNLQGIVYVGCKLALQPDCVRTGCNNARAYFIRAHAEGAKAAVETKRGLISRHIVLLQILQLFGNRAAFLRGCLAVKDLRFVSVLPDGGCKAGQAQRLRAQLRAVEIAQRWLDQQNIHTGNFEGSEGN